VIPGAPNSRAVDEPAGIGRSSTRPPSARSTYRPRGGEKIPAKVAAERPVPRARRRTTATSRRCNGGLLFVRRVALVATTSPTQERGEDRGARRRRTGFLPRRTLPRGRAAAALPSGASRPDPGIAPRSARRARG
jgi:hypothetical protein